MNMGDYYFQKVNMESTIESKRTFQTLGISHQKEAIRIFTKVFGPSHSITVDAKSRFTYVSGLNI
jgi:NADPH-dependent 7-cyano-7-deazaguanine reductase QueF